MSDKAGSSTVGKRPRLPRVELLNVPHYTQGSFDSLCTYYTAAMMLSTVSPKHSVRLGKAATTKAAKRMSHDPIIQNYRDKDHRLTLARWFYLGEYVEKAVEILNRVMDEDGSSTKFEFRPETAHENTFHEVVAGSIDLGLPVMLGWDTLDYGTHSVLVVGYWEGKERWFLINDPGGDSQISWNSLKEQKLRKFEVGLCKPDTYEGIRPLKSEQVDDHTSPTIYQWVGGKGGKYVPV